MKNKKEDKKIRDAELTGVSFQSLALKNSFLILEHTYESAKALLGAFDAMRKQRTGSHIGGTTDQEQDVLRAMLVMTAAGVESMLKQLIRDSLSILFHVDSAVQIELRKFIERKLSTELSSKESKGFLVNLLIAKSIQDQCVKEYVDSLTVESLQSPDELIKSARALGIGQDEVKLDSEVLKKIFAARNNIIHELDVLLGAPKRNRRVRRRSEMISGANYLLALGEKFLVSVNRRISKGTI